MIDVNWNPSRKELRWFAGLQMIFFAIVGWMISRGGGSLVWPAALVSVSVGIGVVGLIRPPWMLPVYRVWMAAVFPIGWTVSHVLLAATFYMVLTPIGLLMRLFGYDPMQRSFDENASTYWQLREEPADSRRYFRQF